MIVNVGTGSNIKFYGSRTVGKDISQLWRSADVDIFRLGKNDDINHIANASPDDTINLYDVTLSDIVATASDGGLGNRELGLGISSISLSYSLIPNPNP